VRADAAQTQIDAFVRPRPTSAAFVAAAAPEASTSPTTDAEASALLRQIESEQSATLSGLLRACTYVGSVDASNVLVQNGTALVLVNVANLAREVWLQCYLSAVPTLATHELALPIPLAAEVRDVLLRYRRPLAERCGVRVDDRGALVALPVAVPGLPPPSGEAAAAAAAAVASALQSCVGGETGPGVVEAVAGALARSLGDVACWPAETVRDAVLPAARNIAPPRRWVSLGTFSVLTTVDKLYKSFERV
jgi:hypothetical protein